MFLTKEIKATLHRIAAFMYWSLSFDNAAEKKLFYTKFATTLSFFITLSLLSVFKQIQTNLESEA